MITDPWFYAAAIPAVLLAGISKGGFGHGAGMFATPLMALTIPVPQAVAILLPIIIAMDLTGVWAYRHAFSRENLRLIFVGGFVGVALGTLSFRYFDESLVRILLGAISIGFVLQRYLRRAIVQPAPRSVPKGLFWSTCAGFTSTIAHAGGPPLSVYLLPQRMDKAVMVGTTVIFFAVINIVKVAPYAWLGLFDAGTLYTALVLLPLAPLGIWLGIFTMRRLSQDAFYRVCYALLLVVGAKILWDGVAQLAA
ncbi:MAG TPA: sulfite exporter TauE/SafE family protein [Usitatibacter sp.]|nr:sulfite exporter TauE/SafE family protein [Usitatibacter sp.]